MQKWYADCKFGVSQRSLLLAYYLATASIFEPERSNERLAWAKTTTLIQTIAAYFEKEGNSSEQRGAFVREFRNSSDQLEHANNERYRKTTRDGLVGALLQTINQLSLNTLAEHGRDIRRKLLHAWESWMMNWEEGGDMFEGEAELLVSCINLCANRWVTGEVSVAPVSNSQYKRLSDITNSVCRQLRRQFQHYHMVGDMDDRNTTVQIESDMQQLAHSVLCSSPDDIDQEIKQTFLAVAKSYYYNAHFTLGTIHFHIAKVLFERVI